MDAKLVVVGGKANKAEVKLKLPTVVGRGRDADLTVAHGTVSRHHCLIYEVDGALVVRDNGSLNGTLIGGERIKESLLKPGDTLTVGPLTFRADYEHNGAFPSLGDQPTIPNFQDTVGEESASGGPAVVAEPPAADRQFDFLDGALATAPLVEEEAGLGVPNFEQPAAEEDADDGPAATAGEQTLDFLAGGSDVAPVSDEEAPGFDFLNQTAAPEAVEQAPAFDSLSESEPSSEIATPEADFPAVDAAADTAEAPEPEAVADDVESEAPAAQASSGSFDFLSVAAEEDAEDESAAALAEEAPPIEQAEASSGLEDPVTTADVEDETVSEASGFDFLNQSQPAAEEAPPELNEEAAAETTDTDAEPDAIEPAPDEKSEGGLDFLSAAADSAADELAVEAPPIEQAGESTGFEEPAASADVEDEAVSEASGFDFLNQSPPAAEEAPPVLNFETANAETANAEAEMANADAEPAAVEQAPDETPVETSEAGFNFLNAAADESAAALDDDAPPIEQAGESSRFEEPSASADVEDELASEVSSFDFLSQSPPAAEEAPSELNLETAPADAADVEAEPAAVDQASDDQPVETSVGGFDFVSAAADDAADEQAAALDEEVPHTEPTAESSAMEEPELTANLEDEPASEISGFDFLNPSQPAAEAAPPALNFEAAAAQTADAEAEPAAIEPAAADCAGRNSRRKV